MFRDDSICDDLIRIMILMIGAAQISHLYTYFTGKNLQECSFLFLGMAAVLVLLYFCLRPVLKRRFSKDEASERITALTKGEWLTVGVTLLNFLAQAAVILSGSLLYRDGDMTAETVAAALESGHLYAVNPLTGGAYEEGIALRLVILCLPALYGSLCRLLNLSPYVLVYYVVPTAVLLLSYAALGTLGRSLFPKDRKKRLLFMAAAATLLWAGRNSYGQDGFGLLACGFRGVTIRNTVLVPYTFALCIRKKYLLCAFTVLAEACIVWTLYGLGVCAAVTAGMLSVSLLLGRKEGQL